MKMIFHTAEQQEAWGQSLGLVLPTECVIFLSGDLGAGKTTLVRGVLQGLGHKGNVKSPTYTLVEPYELPDRLFFHFDLYRLVRPEELDYIGLDDYFSQNATVVVEWPERAQQRLPIPDVQGILHFCPEGRELVLTACTPRGEAILKKLKNDNRSSILNSITKIGDI